MWADRGTEKNILCPIFVPVFERDSLMKERNSGMSRMIIELSDGIITGIYTDSMEDYQVEITDPDDENDLERAADRRRLVHLIGKGGLRDILNGEEEQDEVSPAPGLDPGVLVLITEDGAAKTENGRRMQLLEAAYLDGYLTASARLTKFITRLFREKNPDASAIYNCLKPIISQFDTGYCQLCRQLNEKAYDDIARKDREEQE